MLRQGALSLVVVCLAIVAMSGVIARAAEDKKPSATGTWKWSMTTRDGQTRESAIKLKQEGEKLTGAYIGRNGQEIAIEDGQVKGDEVSFSLSREFNNQKFTSKFKGKLEGDTIKGTTETEINGQVRSREWTANRSAEVTGTWKYARERQDGTKMEITLKLKQEGEKLTGSFAIGDRPETAIDEGKVNGKEITFTITRERDGNKMVSKFSGVVEGDVLKGKTTGTWNGEERTFEWEAKRAAE